METKYIVAIVAGALFLALFIAFIIIFDRNRKREAEKKYRLSQMYADKNLVKMDYDLAGFDEETEKLLASRSERRKQMSFNDIYPAVIPDSDNPPSLAKEADGIEEITGNYKPEQ